MDRYTRVLLIDDDEDEFVLHRDLLGEGTDGSYELDWIDNYENGLADLKRGAHDAYLIDYRLGERTGIDLLRSMQDVGLDRAMIILTGQTDDDVDRSAMELGASDYLVKGETGSAELVRAIRYAIERCRNVSRLRFQAEILRNVHDAVFYVTEDGIVRDWNEGAARIFCVSAEEAVGRSLMEICPHPGVHPFVRSIRPAVKKHGVAEEVIHCRLAKGGDVYVRAKATRLNLQGGEGYVFCASDITKEKRLEAEIVRISENEQRRIGQDIHDDLCSQLSGIGCMTKVLEQRLRGEHAEEAAMMGGITEMVAQAGTKAREIAKGLVPAVLETQGLVSALRELAAKRRELFGANCIASIREDEGIEAISDVISIQIYRIAQEALTNAVRHSDAELIELSLRLEDGCLDLKVRDNGKGMAREPVSSGLGLMTMRRRAEMIDAEFHIKSSPGAGTEISCRVPLKK
ncbi:MAG: response regulator [Verrucomicrobiae bacterium]|nr:response regulator [Verrucomicrobiae bacterium]